MPAASWAARWVGRQYGEDGCWALVADVYDVHEGKSLPDLRPAAAVSTELSVAIQEWKKWARVETPQERDMVLMWEGGRAAHVGVYAGGGMVLHHEKGTGVVCVPLEGLPVQGFYRRG